jgi:hypothetical protein
LEKNLIVCWFGMFATSVGMSQIAPVMPLYIDHLGMHDTPLNPWQLMALCFLLGLAMAGGVFEVQF